MNILDTLAASAKEETLKRKKRVSEDEMRLRAEQVDSEPFLFEKALSSPGVSFICELKKASPSKGLICPDFDYLRFAKEYEEGGASAVSCLTEPTKFLGSVEILSEVAESVKIPVLRKDFVVDPYQIYEAKANGASAVLLICAILDEERLREFIELADSLGLSALVETHDEKELEMALRAGARVVGVNNRNLKDFTVDFDNSIRMAEKIPEGVIFVSESGIHTPEDIARLEKAGVNAVLIGERLMASGDIPKALGELMDYES